ncbi:hypothetical protein DIS24_g2149 [Lasiodiplodia hormozganensis]|uniref:Uncharacterized protein n=1 Tax=Lasiodiplodia hormozganensis TaxID=869390 RepID=A0AA39Z0X1_9PEZI|nr:hypothetical protein DIS24_g2149 [Lasiodiplodia hormozganensis]
MPPKDSSPSTANAILLRRITIFIFLPAFPLLLAHGVAGHRPFPALGLLPLAGSAVLGGFVLYRDRVTVSGSAIQQLSTSGVFFADVLLTALYLAILIASWVTLTTNSWRYDSSLVILGTYGTVGLLANFVIHLYFVGLQGLRMLVSRPCNCAHCQSVSKRGPFMRMVSEYTLLSEEDVEEESYTDVEAGNERISM